MDFINSFAALFEFYCINELLKLFISDFKCNVNRKNGELAKW